VTGAPSDTVRIAAVGDLHWGKGPHGSFQPFFQKISEHADVLLLCGDLVNDGLPGQAQGLAKELTSWVKIPTLAVLGNHDYEAGKEDEVRRILSDAGVTVLDGDARELRGVGFAGVKGFGGGFGGRALQPWGEATIKAFVREAVDEAVKLESALARLRTPRQVVLMHYAPIAATADGEPADIMPFLGSSRLEEPLNRYPVTAVFHGHAHHGALEGKTMSGVPVYNVAMPLLQKHAPDRPPFRVLEVRAAPEPAAGGLPR
jgi:Icc-related predicted phosphoesterase